MVRLCFRLERKLTSVLDGENSSKAENKEENSHFCEFTQAGSVVGYKSSGDLISGRRSQDTAQADSIHREFHELLRVGLKRRQKSNQHF